MSAYLMCMNFTFSWLLDALGLFLCLLLRPELELYFLCLRWTMIVMSYIGVCGWSLIVVHSLAPCCVSCPPCVGSGCPYGFGLVKFTNILGLAKWL